MGFIQEQEHPYQEILCRIRGQKVLYPGFGQFFVQYAPQPNPYYLNARTDADIWLEENCPHPKKLNKLKQADFALLVSYMYPFAEQEALICITRWFMWIFVQDDECDEVTGDRANDFTKAQEYRLTTKRFVRWCLGLKDECDVEAPVPSTKIMGSFKAIGDFLRKAYTREQCQVFLEGLEEFLDCCQAEQEYRISGKILTFEEFWYLRMGDGDHSLGTIGGAIGLAVIELGVGMRAPRDPRIDPGIKNFWAEVNNILGITNDMFSLKKELSGGEGGILNIVPVLFTESGNMQEAIDRSIRYLKASIKRFEEAAAAFMSDESNPLGLSVDEKQLLVKAFRVNFVGHFDWCTQTMRYKVGDFTPGIESFEHTF